MRKLIPHIVLLLLVANAATGCDFFRRLAGRPTSEIIEALREASLANAPVSVPDTVAVVETATDTLAAAEPKAEPKVEPKAEPKVEPKSEPKTETVTGSDGKKRFYVVVASFSNPDNARKSLERMKERGYPGDLLSAKGGYTVVGICGTDDEQEAKESLKQLQRQDFCPKGVWIIDRNKR